MEKKKSMYITALDLGTSQIRAIVAETQKDGKLSLLSVLKIPSIGLRKGEIASLDEAVHSLNRIINEIKQINKSASEKYFYQYRRRQYKISKFPRHCRGFAGR